jgi:hypothetical protein
MVTVYVLISEDHCEKLQVWLTLYAATAVGIRPAAPTDWKRGVRWKTAWYVIAFDAGRNACALENVRMRPLTFAQA